MRLQAHVKCCNTILMGIRECVWCAPCIRIELPSGTAGAGSSLFRFSFSIRLLLFIKWVFPLCVFLNTYSNYLFYSHVSNEMAEYREAAANCRLCYVWTANSVASRQQHSIFHPTNEYCELRNTIFQFWTMRNKSFLHSILGGVRTETEQLRSASMLLFWKWIVIILFIIIFQNNLVLFLLLLFLSQGTWGIWCEEKTWTTPSYEFCIAGASARRVSFFVIQTNKKCLKATRTVLHATPCSTEKFITLYLYNDSVTSVAMQSILVSKIV